MSYIIIEMFGGPEYAIIVTDQEGNNLVFETCEAAETEASACQNALVVEL